MSKDILYYFLRNTVRVAGEILPSIAYHKDFKEAETISSSKIETFVEDTIEDLF